MDGDELKLSFGRRLKFLREVKRLTQARLAEMVGVTEQYMSMIERGLSSPSFDVIAKLCDGLLVDPAGLFMPQAEAAARDEVRERRPLDWSRSLIRMGGFQQDLPTERLEWTVSLKEMFGVRLGEEHTTWDLFLERVASGDRAAVAEIRDRLQEGVEVGVFRFDFLRRDDSLGQALAYAEVESDEYGAPNRIHCLILDVTERVRMEELHQQVRESLEVQLRERTGKLARTARRMEEEALGRKKTEAALDRKRREFDAVMEIVPDTVYLADDKGRLLAVNPAAARSWGGLPEDFVGKNRFHMLRPGVAEARKSRFDRVRATGAAVRYRDERDGRTYESVINPISGSDHKPSAFVVHARDVTEDDQTVARLRQSEATLAAVLSSAPVGIGLVSRERVLSMVNYRLCEILGYLPVDLEGKNTRMLYVSEEEYDHVGRLLYPKLGGVGTACLETRMVRKDGQVLEIMISAAALDAGDLSKGLIFTLLDISGHKRLQTLREDMERVIRHDLRQPAQSVMGVCQLLSAGDNLTEKQVLLLGRLEAAAVRMLDLLNLSLDLHALESGAYRLDPADVDLAELCRGVLTEAAQRFNRSARDLRLLLNGNDCGASDRLRIKGDGRLLRSVLENLVHNALEAGNKGRVTVALENGGDVSVSVHNPQPVPEPMRAVFFDKYATSGKDGGRGLGTYAVRLVAELHGGSAHMDSSDRAGTTVTVRLPGRVAA